VATISWVWARHCHPRDRMPNPMTSMMGPTQKPLRRVIELMIHRLIMATLREQGES
jgi:hypothetical protein